MGNSILRGMSTALLVTVITLLAGMFWTAMGLGGLTMSTLVDIGLIASCVTAGYKAGKVSGQWILGGVSALGYVILCIMLLSLFIKVSGWGAIQVLGEGGLIGILAGAFGAGSATGGNRPAGSWKSPGRFSSWSSPYNRDSYHEGLSEDWDSHVDDWDVQGDKDLQQRQSTFWEGEGNSKDWKGLKSSNKRELESSIVRSSRAKEAWEEDEWAEGLDSSKQDVQRDSRILQKNSEEDEWEGWVREEKKKNPTKNYRKAWWEEDVL